MILSKWLLRLGMRESERYGGGEKKERQFVCFI